ncbi:hypothetical protein A6V39_04100 [Candidatus Mycoplasma haematobovis]|uniref:Uncharacterized protein n=1 Tax=Candidatus Mycoplasma haematobovis TaxID=432608 RepID=A0A1A9QDJ2_9MOLU|nr:hypothetical protein [Candidatus Mycoplasma haematobovis]OAL10071.1 hypothetical protein A6V39_04100 [Candidatus Mycoplasma haematobovis]
MAFRFNSVALLLSSLLTGGGAWLGYELYKPKTVEGWVNWKGLKLATEDKDNLWKALYFQGKHELGEKIKDWEELKKSCVKAWKQKTGNDNKDLEYVEKFCLDNLKTRKARIIATGFDEKIFLKEDEDFKVEFTFNRYSPTFLELLGEKKTDKEPEIDKNQPLLEKYKKYCEDELSANDTKIEVVKQICSKQHKYQTAEQKLTSEGLILKSLDDLKGEWKNYRDEKKSKNYRIGNTLLEDIKDTSTQDSWIELQDDQNKFGQRFNEWCSNQKDKKLYEENFYKETYPKFKTRCSKSKTGKLITQTE